MKTLKFNRLYIKIGLYGALLYSVLAVMQYVKSSTFSTNVNTLLGSPAETRYLEWCSPNAQRVFFINSKTTIQDPKIIQEICRIAYSSYKADEITHIQWQPLLKSLNKKGEETLLETNSSLTFVKNGSLIFKTKGLKPKLISLGLIKTEALPMAK